MAGNLSPNTARLDVVKPPRPGDAMLHPAVLGALVLLIVNDHLLKGALAGTALSVVTGKLSDVAGLAFFPVLLFSLAEIAMRRAPASVPIVLACVVVTELVFALTKTWTPAADLYRFAIASLQWPVHAIVALADGRAAPGLAAVRHVMDPTDLVALPAAGLAIVVGVRRSRRAQGPQMEAGTTPRAR